MAPGGASINAFRRSAGHATLGVEHRDLRRELRVPDLHGEHIGLGDDAGVEAGLRLLEVGDRRFDRAPRRAERGITADDVHVRIDGRHREIPFEHAPSCLGHRAARFRLGQGGTCYAAVVQEHLGVEHELVVRDRVGIVELIDGEIGGGEAALREQRAEGEHRIVAALPGLAHVDARPPAGFRLGDARLGLVDAGGGTTKGRMAGTCPGDGLVEREGCLGSRGHRACAGKQ